MTDVQVKRRVALAQINKAGFARLLMLPPGNRVRNVYWDVVRDLLFVSIEGPDMPPAGPEGSPLVPMAMRYELHDPTPGDKIVKFIGLEPPP